MSIYSNTIPVERNDIKTAWAMPITKFTKRSKSKRLINRIILVAGSCFKVDLKRSKSINETKFVSAKYAAIILLQEFSDLSNVEIGRLLNYCDHTCVYSAQRKFQNDEDFRRAVNELKQKL